LEKTEKGEQKEMNAKNRKKQQQLKIDCQQFVTFIIVIFLCFMFVKTAFAENYSGNKESISTKNTLKKKNLILMK
jgi:hypothetical protein